MSRIPGDYLERVYAGWLAKIIGIRLGAAVEGWDYERIAQLFGELTYYPAYYRNFAADDDSNGPLYFLRALEDKRGETLTAQDVGEALLNYAPYEHGFFWWGGYGISTEHTAYLNLRRGIKAPRSGSAEMNTMTVAEQIGGQIFIDTWGLVAPGNPALAADLAAKAASVTHDRNGIYGGVFVACAISAAFVEHDIRKVIETALGFIPQDCEYTRAVRAVLAFHDSHPDSGWRDCFQYVHDQWGYDRYPGACHIIPNCAVMALAMAYGNGNFDDTLNICNMCGWDTDCNVGNVATIMGVLCGIDAIDTEKWIRPVNDLCIRSGVMGDMNITDIPYGASYIASLAYQLAGEDYPVQWKEWLGSRIHDCHFEYPKSTHALCVRSEGPYNTAHIFNTDEDAHTGKRCLRFFATRLQPGQQLYLYRKTYYWKEDFSDSRYDPVFSPILYPGQTVSGWVRVPEYGSDTWGCAYARDSRRDVTVYGEKVRLLHGAEWQEVKAEIPAMEGGLIDEAGFCLWTPDEKVKKGYQLAVLVDDLHFDGLPDYSLDFKNEKTEVWSERHTDITQISRMKGRAELIDGLLHIGCDDEGEWYTGSSEWRDYTVKFSLIREKGCFQDVLVRVQGAIRSYAVGFDGEHLRLRKNDNGYRTLAEAPCCPAFGKEITVTVTVKGNRISAGCGDAMVEYEDHDRPYLHGSVGVAVRDGSTALIRSISVRGQT